MKVNVFQAKAEPGDVFPLLALNGGVFPLLLRTLFLGYTVVERLLFLARLVTPCSQALLSFHPVRSLLVLDDNSRERILGGEDGQRHQRQGDCTCCASRNPAPSHSEHLSLGSGTLRFRVHRPRERPRDAWQSIHDDRAVPVHCGVWLCRLLPDYLVSSDRSRSTSTLVRRASTDIDP